MTVKFNRRKIEATCIFISFVLIILLTILGILAVADGLFYWDILPENIQKIATLFMIAAGLVICATFLINLMANLSIISLSLEKLVKKLDDLKK